MMLHHVDVHPVDTTSGGSSAQARESGAAVTYMVHGWRWLIRVQRDGSGHRGRHDRLPLDGEVQWDHGFTRTRDVFDRRETSKEEPARALGKSPTPCGRPYTVVGSPR